MNTSSFDEAISFLRNNMSQDSYAVALGKTDVGDYVTVSMQKTGNILIGGTAGSGKTTLELNIVATLLQSSINDHIQFVFVTPKYAEFALFKNIPQLYCPTVKDCDEFTKIIHNVYEEMQHRIELMNDSNSRILTDHNMSTNSKIPQIYIVIDEYLHLIDREFKEDELKLILMKGRPAGIHVILATQRPGSVPKGFIRDYFSTKVALLTSTSFDSKAIIDVEGAELLNGNGDGLVKQDSIEQIKHIKVPYISNAEIRSIISNFQN